MLPFLFTWLFLSVLFLNIGVLKAFFCLCFHTTQSPDDSSCFPWVHLALLPGHFLILLFRPSLSPKFQMHLHHNLSGTPSPVSSLGQSNSSLQPPALPNQLPLFTSTKQQLVLSGCDCISSVLLAPGLALSPPLESVFHRPRLHRSASTAFVYFYCCCM